MISFDEFELSNGLRVIVHEDVSTPLVAVNVLYKVGSRDEDPNKTGYAHLLEHLMFSGSTNIKSFDDAVQRAGGESNAFTNTDMTNFYQTLPAQNIETAFWLESDRMLNLRFNKRLLEVQRKVVMEEFKETTLDTPYGEVWHDLMAMAYTHHPYRWPTIGLTPEHIAQATLEDIRLFYETYYQPNNAILSIAGNVNVKIVKDLAKKWFGDIPSNPLIYRDLPKEPKKNEKKLRKKEAKVPLPALYMVWAMPDRLSPDYYSIDLLSDILGNGDSSRLLQKLLKQERLFSEIDAYISGTLDAGLFIIEAKPSVGISLEVAENAIWAELQLLKKNLIGADELQKVKNKTFSNLLFSEMGVLNKAMNLGFFALLGNTELINLEYSFYENVSVEDIQKQANNIFSTENANVLYYEPFDFNTV